MSSGDGVAHWAIEVEEVLPSGRFRARLLEATAPIVQPREQDARIGGAPRRDVV